jgi:hypothetical protein
MNVHVRPSEYILWCEDAHTCGFTTFDEAVRYFALDFERGGNPRLYTFDPDRPWESREITHEAIRSMPEDDPYEGMTEAEIAYDRAASAASRQYQATKETF